MGVILLLFGIVLCADAVAVGIMFMQWADMLPTLIIGILVIIWGMNYKKLKNGRGFKALIRGLFKIMCVYIIGMSMLLAIFGAVNDTDYKEDYVIVLGSGIRKSQPQLLLLERLKTAVNYCEENPDAKVIVTGGQGPGENTAEANVMYAYLTEKGISANRIITETSSHNTYENFMLSYLEANSLGSSDVVTITNGFHIFRAKLYAKICGIDTHTLSAKTKPYLIPVMYIRESMAIIKMLAYYIPRHFA